MNTYVDGFVLPLLNEKIEEYRALAEQASAVWREHGALSYQECVLDDDGAENMVSFAKLFGAHAGETVVFAWATFPSREARDAANQAIMSDPRLKDACTNAPFDYTRMAYGGFRTIVQA